MSQDTIHLVASVLSRRRVHRFDVRVTLGEASSNIFPHVDRHLFHPNTSPDPYPLALGPTPPRLLSAETGMLSPKAQIEGARASPLPPPLGANHSQFAGGNTLFARLTFLVPPN
jgi:hypothetical protein